MIRGENKVPIGWFGGLKDLINTSKRSRGLKIRFQLSTRVPNKVTTFLLTVRCTVFEVEVEVEVEDDD